jgi:hypothetical protein
MTKAGERCARRRLLVLLWIWAICVLMIVDLFLNLSEFDGTRPHADFYRALRVAGHKMVGEPLLEGDEPADASGLHAGTAARMIRRGEGNPSCSNARELLRSIGSRQRNVVGASAKRSTHHPGVARMAGLRIRNDSRHRLAGHGEGGER